MKAITHASNSRELEDELFEIFTPGSCGRPRDPPPLLRPSRAGSPATTIPAAEEKKRLVVVAQQWRVRARRQTVRGQHLLEGEPRRVADLGKVVGGRAGADHLVGSAVHKRAVKHAVAPEGRRDFAALQLRGRKDVVVVDPLLGHELAGDHGLGMGKSRALPPSIRQIAPR